MITPLLIVFLMSNTEQTELRTAWAHASYNVIARGGVSTEIAI
jgi:hypothetical protein